MIFLTLVIAACFFTVMQCYEKAVPQSGEQMKSVSPVKDAGQFTRQRNGEERLPAKEWIEAMPEDTLRYFALNILIVFGFPEAVQAAASVKGRVEKAAS